jgi:hypothetical protein
LFVSDREGEFDDGAAARASHPILHPAFSGHPSHSLAGTAVEKGFVILFWEPARPFFKPLLGESGALGMGVVQ